MPHMRILEISDQEGAAAYCGKLFARWGHHVTRLESPGRDAPEAAADIYLNGGKRRVALDLEVAAQREAFARLAARCDILVTDRPVREIEALGLLDVAGPAVRLALTPFGLTGPYAGYPATEASLLALGGYTYLMGDPDREPLTFPGRYASYHGGTLGYAAALATWRRVADPSHPVTVDVSLLECLASLHQSTYSKYLESGEPRGRSGNRMDGAANSLLPVRDGWVGVSFQQQFWFSFATMIGRLDIAEDHPLSTPGGRMKHYDELVRVVDGAFRDRDMQDLFDEAQGHWRLPVGKLLGVLEALDDPHLVARGFWRPLGDAPPALARLRVPGSPFQIAGEPAPVERTPRAPGADPAEPPAMPSPARPSLPALTDLTRPLEGLRVLDLTRVWSGPVTGRLLGDLGADVIKVEAPDNRGPRDVRPGTRGYLITERTAGMPWNAQTVFNQLQRNRRSLCVDLKTGEGKRIFLDLVAVSDVVLENFSARALSRLGLGYDVLKEANPRVIYMPMPAFGRSGPYRDYVGLGTSVEPLAAIPSIMGYAGGDARSAAIAIPDPMAGTTALAAVMTALARRDATGEGCELDFSQQEGAIAFIGESFIEAQLTGRSPGRLGNGHARFAPHNVYPCRGSDDWIAIGIRDGREWAALDAVAGQGWGRDPRFASADGRREHREALDRLIAGWTASQEKRALTERLLGAGVPAGGVSKSHELMADPQLEARGYFADLHHPVTGLQRFDGAPFVFNGRRGHAWWAPTPTLGEHNREVLATVLHRDEDEVVHLAAAGILADAPPDA